MYERKSESGTPEHRGYFWKAPGNGMKSRELRRMSGQLLRQTAWWPGITDPVLYIAQTGRNIIKDHVDSV